MDRIVILKPDGTVCTMVLIENAMLKDETFEQFAQRELEKLYTTSPDLRGLPTKRCSKQELLNVIRQHPKAYGSSLKHDGLGNLICDTAFRPPIEIKEELKASAIDKLTKGIKLTEDEARSIT